MIALLALERWKEEWPTGMVVSKYLCKLAGKRGNLWKPSVPRRGLARQKARRVWFTFLFCSRIGLHNGGCS